MDTAFDIPAEYMLSGCNASGSETMWWHYIDWGSVTRSVKSLQIRIAKAVTAQQWLKKVKEVIVKQSNVRTLHLIKKLNPMLRGWGMYHRHIAAKKTFSTIDHRIFKMTWRWSKRRHCRKKDALWIKKRYFTRIEGRDWLFFDKEETTQKRYTLFQVASIPIKRHVKIDSKANTYLPSDEPYFEMRTQIKMADKWAGRQLTNFIYKRQKGCCAYCGERIDLKTGWHLHHIVQRIHGGKDRADNLVMLHPNCHKSVHVNKFSFTRPFTQKAAASSVL